MQPQARRDGPRRICTLSALTRAASEGGSLVHGGAIGESGVITSVARARGLSTVTPPSHAVRRSAAPETRGRSGTPNPKEVARGSAAGGGGAVGAAACADGDGRPVRRRGERGWIGRRGADTVAGTRTLDWGDAAVLVGAARRGPTLVVPIDVAG